LRPIPSPRYWDEIIAFAKLPRGTGRAEKRIAVRPSMDQIHAAFADLLRNIEFANCTKNPGYLKAFGLPIAN
jgi:hypothetical protein